MNYSKIGTIEGICLIVIIIFNHIVLNLPQSITDSCGSSSVLNVLYISFFMFLLVLLIIRLFKNFQTQDILDIAEYLGGKFLKYAVGITFSLFLIFTFSTLLRNFSEILKIVYFPYVPMGFIVVLFLIVVVVINTFGKKTVIKANAIITPIIALSLFITFLLVGRSFSFERIFPILGYGAKETFLTGLSNLFAFNGICYLFFIMPYLENKGDFKKIGIGSVVIISIFLVLAIGSLLLTFPFVKFTEALSPVYLIIKTAKFGTFIQRPEALFVLTWILSLLSYLSVGLMFLLIIFKKLTNVAHERAMAPCFATLIYIVAWIPSGMADIRFFESTLYKYSSLILLFGIFIPILLLANIKYKKKHPKNMVSEGGDGNEKLS